jgi:hypothetical protein
MDDMDLEDFDKPVATAAPVADEELEIENLD